MTEKDSGIKVSEDGRTIAFSTEALISDMDSPKWYKEEMYRKEMYRKALNLGDKCTVLWEGDRIKGFRPDRPMEYINVTLTISKDELGELKITDSDMETTNDD